jgi:hypothetical protein
MVASAVVVVGMQVLVLLFATPVHPGNLASSANKSALVASTENNTTNEEFALPARKASTEISWVNIRAKFAVQDNIQVLEKRNVLCVRLGALQRRGSPNVQSARLESTLRKGRTSARCAQQGHTDRNSASLWPTATAAFPASFLQQALQIVQIVPKASSRSKVVISKNVCHAQRARTKI